MLFTVGHSTHNIETFLSLLTINGVTAIADVRSSPYSRFSPQFTREALKQSLRLANVAYTFLGKELGARSDNPACYRGGKVQYDLLAQQPAFADGIARVNEGMARYTIALMCAEKDPIECHRALLVAACGVPAAVHEVAAGLLRHAVVRLDPSPQHRREREAGHERLLQPHARGDQARLVQGQGRPEAGHDRVRQARARHLGSLGR